MKSRLDIILETVSEFLYEKNPGPQLWRDFVKSQRSYPKRGRKGVEIARRVAGFRDDGGDALNRHSNVASYVGAKVETERSDWPNPLVDPIITNATRRHPKFAGARDDGGEFVHPDEITYNTIRGQKNSERIRADFDAIASERRRRALLPSSPSRLALTYDVPPRGMGPEDGIPPRGP